MRFTTIWSVLSLLAPLAVEASVLAIDYGADFMKASLMKPGVPFDVLLNKDSKRKIPSVVGWKKSDRVFGGDAFNLASRFPSDVFLDVKLLQAVPYDSDAVSFYTKISTADVTETARKTVALRQSDGKEWSAEELIAMQFAYIKDLAESFAQEKVRDVIVTVPPYYSQFERDAVVDAIEISGLKTLALINDGTAVAVNYAMTRNFNGPKPEYHIVYDAGASAIRATVVGFSNVKDKKEGAGTQISVAGVGWDRDVGGLELDRRLREILAKAFEEKHKKDVKKDKKGMMKLWKEANRIKAILSANTEAVSTVESLAYDIDFKSKVSRATFEKACEDLKPKFVQPIYDALNAAGLDLDNITSLIFTGGSTRTPMIQAAVKAAVGEDKLAYNVNADEAAVLGAALQGASLSRQFKTKNIKVNDVGVYDVQATYAAAATSPNAKPRSITTLIFPAGSKVGTKKTLTFKRKDDFTISLDYRNSVAPGFPTRLLEADIVGVAEAITNLTERGAIDPVVKATLTLSDSGFVSVSDAVVFGEIKDDSITGKLKGFFAGSSSTEETSTGSAENTPPRETPETSESASASTTTSSSSAAPEPTPVKKEKEEKKAPVENTIALTVDVRFTTIAPMTIAQKQESRKRLRAVDQEEAIKARREEARNTFESYLYRLRDLLDDENRETPFKKCSRETEREAIAVKLDDSFQWLFERGDLAETSQFLDKRIALETLEKPIVHRYKEIEAFPEALNNSQKWNWHTRMFLTEARQNLTAEIEADLPSKWTGDELDALETTLKEHESWLNEWVEKQRSVKSYEDPVIETTEMKARAKVLETQLYKLVKRKIPKAKKPKAKKAAEEDAKATETAEGAKPTASPPPPEQGEKTTEERKHDEL
ncbi:actin-like ATPase domain-containing protein [Macrolepiota fuliginosa MF-IS2]|uniref:Actin-like ATPase domain-containing protein n=1 Tax=Macrolepiota fuliginosa MF-IS2 TaxID=1400762 RepID=A0A9P5XDL9_9AGAR|nr:actin-like ATPase domain-containing protein [Macrolepiota fuliginosa MF-IS2]